MPHEKWEFGGRRDRGDWDRWRGSVDEKMESHHGKIEDHCERLTVVEDKVGAILVKLAVPLFLTSLVGVGIGGLIVALLTKAMK